MTYETLGIDYSTSFITEKNKFLYSRFFKNQIKIMNKLKYENDDYFTAFLNIMKIKLSHKNEPIRNHLYINLMHWKFLEREYIKQYQAIFLISDYWDGAPENYSDQFIECSIDTMLNNEIMKHKIYKILNKKICHDVVSVIISYL